MVDLIHSILYPFANRKNFLKTVLLGIINMFWYLFIPIIFINGYFVKLIRNTVKGNEEMPNWPGTSLSGWWYIIKHGFIFTLITAAYLAIPFIFTYIGITIKSFSLILLSVVLLLAVLFILPMALIYYASTESIVQAFNIPEIISTIIKHIGKYLLVGLVSSILYILFFSITPYIPYIAGVFLILPSIIAFHGFAQILGKH